MALTLAATAARAIQLPAGFVAEDAVPGAGFVVPVAIAFFPASDGRMLVGEKRGRVYAVKNGVKYPTPMWQSENEVLDDGDRGLLGVAVDPDYSINHYVYFLYTVDPDSDGVDTNGDGFGRLVRYRTSAADSNVVDGSTRTVLMGSTWTDGPIIGSPSHTIGSLRWGADKSLLVTCGDGAQYGDMDPGGNDPEMFQAGKANPYDDIGAFRSQYLGSLCGKLLRLDRFTGRGLPSNPFWDGNPVSARSRIWAYGLRNPFRFTVKPGTGSADSSLGAPGTLYIGDVGWANWEEADIAKTGGKNFGWPCYEGIDAQLAYQAANPLHAGCDSIGTNIWDPNPVTLPVATWNHSDPNAGTPPGFRGNTSIGGAFYTGTGYPGIYQNHCFIGDYGANWIQVLVTDSNDALVTVLPFATDAEGPVDFAISPLNGDLYYVSIFSFEVRRIRYTGSGGSNTPPTAQASGAPTLGAPPLLVNFSSAGTFDIDGDTLSYVWTFGDGFGSTAPNPSHTYNAFGTFTAVLTVDDGHGGVGRDSVIVTCSATAGFPNTGILDDFNRPDGPIGGSWVDQTTGLFIQNDGLIHTGGYGTVVWNGASFGPVQEAYFTLLAVTPTSPEHDVMLKIQGASSNDSHIEVRWDANAGGVFIATYTPGPGWEQRGSFPLVLQPGDQFGARADGNGQVSVFVNHTLLGTVDCSSWPYAAAGGRIGIAFDNATSSRMDDFGGGTVVPNTPPNAWIPSPPDSSFYIAGDTLTFVGGKSDAEDPPAALLGHWSARLVHNNHFHIEAETDGDSLTLITYDHDDGTGVYLLLRWFVTDTGALRDTAEVRLFPEVDLEPTAVACVPAAPPSGSHATFDFWIRNHGRLKSKITHWSLAAGGTTLAEGDTLVAALDSVRITRLLPVTLDPGDYDLRVVADTLGTCVETNETNNASTGPLTVTGAPVAVGERAFGLALSNAYPNPSGGRMSLALTLPGAARVEFSVLDVQGRIVWSAPARVVGAGRTTLGWDGTDGAAAAVRPGLYLARVTVGDRVLLRRFAIVR